MCPHHAGSLLFVLKVALLACVCVHHCAHCCNLAILPSAGLRPYPCPFCFGLLAFLSFTSSLNRLFFGRSQCLVPPRLHLTLLFCGRCCILQDVLLRFPAVFVCALRLLFALAGVGLDEVMKHAIAVIQRQLPFGVQIEKNRNIRGQKREVDT